MSITNIIMLSLIRNREVEFIKAMAYGLNGIMDKTPHDQSPSNIWFTVIV